MGYYEKNEGFKGGYNSYGLCLQSVRKIMHSGKYRE